MSLRQYRKVLTKNKNDKTNKTDKNNGDNGDNEKDELNRDESESEDEDRVVRKNMFIIDEDVKDNEEDDEDDEEEESRLSIKKKKKNKKKKSKKINSNNDCNDNDSNNINEKSEVTASISNMTSNDTFNLKSKSKNNNKNKMSNSDSEDLDLLISSFTSTNMNSSSIVPTNNKSYLSILICDIKYFDADLEMIRSFGSDVIKSELLNNRMKKSRSNILIRPCTDWPKTTFTGLSMKKDISNSHDYSEFKFIYDDDYKRLQKDFKKRVSTYDPQSISYMHSMHPYHIDTLIQMSEIYKQHGEFTKAADFIERALHRLELSFCSTFKPWNSECRVDYTIEENQSLFMVLYRHIQFLGRKGATRTALEFCKLLLSLSPDLDPLCILLLIDHFALRAKEERWLLKFITDFKQIFINSDGNKSVSDVFLLPSFVFSASLAQFYLTDANMPTDLVSKDIEPLDSLIRRGNSSDLLLHALLIFPELLEPLIEKCVDNCHSSKWQFIFQNDWFAEAAKRRERIIALQKLISVYVDKNSVLWKSPQILDWLYSNALLITTRVNDSNIDLDGYSKLRISLFDADKPSKYSRILVSEFSDMISTMPADELPLPGLPQNIDDIDIENLPPQIRQQMMELQQMQYEQMLLGNDAQAQILQSEELRNANPLFMFFRSMLPWVNVGGANYQPGLMPPVNFRNPNDRDDESDDD